MRSRDDQPGNDTPVVATDVVGEGAGPVLTADEKRSLRIFLTEALAGDELVLVFPNIP